MITVMGASGHTGRKITDALLKSGEKVRALCRSERSLTELKSRGADAMIGDAADADFLTDAFRDADAVYTLLPTDRRSVDYLAEADRQGKAIFKAVLASGVRYVVALSSLGADLIYHTGVIKALHVQEERLKMLINANVLLLRPVSFFENFFYAFEFIRYQGAITDSVNANLAIPMVSTRDIADVAAKALRERNWQGFAVRELLGPRNISFPEAARIIGERIGRPYLRYIQASYEEMSHALMHSGLSWDFARLYVEMTCAFNEGRIKPSDVGNRAILTPTRFEEFADELAQAYKGLVRGAA